MNIQQYLFELQQSLRPLNNRQKRLFGAWCIMALAQDSAALSFIDRYLSAGLSGQILSWIEGIWNNPLRFPASIHRPYLTQLQWNSDDIPPKEEPASQGAQDILGALESLMGAIISPAASDMIPCAETLINKLDYCIEFSSSRYTSFFQNLLKEECYCHILFLSRLKEDRITGTDLLLFHEHLPASFAKLYE